MYFDRIWKEQPLPSKCFFSHYLDWKRRGRGMVNPVAPKHRNNVNKNTANVFGGRKTSLNQNLMDFGVSHYYFPYLAMLHICNSGSKRLKCWIFLLKKTSMLNESKQFKCYEKECWILASSLQTYRHLNVVVIFPGPDLLAAGKGEGELLALTDFHVKVW